MLHFGHDPGEHTNVEPRHNTVHGTHFGSNRWLFGELRPVDRVIANAREDRKCRGGGDGGSAPQQQPPSTWCPAVIYYTQANIRADLPATIDQAIASSFKACRKTDCIEARLDTEGSWSDSHLFAPVSLKFTSNPGGSAVELRWSHPAELNDFMAPDEYELTFSTDSANTPAAPLTVFDTEVTYVEMRDDSAFYGNPHPELCGSWGVAEVDLRSKRNE